MNSSLQVLTDVLQLTREGRLHWRKVDFDLYEAPLKTGVVSIRFDYPMMGDERVSGADLAVVSVGQVIMNFFNGTEGMSLVLDILAAGFPGWREHREQIEQKLAQARALLAAE